MTNYKEIYIISELCGQWGGSERRLNQMIYQSLIGGANAVKVQLYDTYKMPGENRHLWEYLNISKSLFFKIADQCKELNIDFFASAFDEERWGWICEKGMKINKIASSLLKSNIGLCEKMIQNEEMHHFISLGHWADSKLPFGTQNNITYLHCVPKYPHSAEEAINLLPLDFKVIKGYSDHSIGIEACRSAIDKGCKFIEKHFSTNISTSRDTEKAHSCSMDLFLLSELRSYADKYDIVNNNN